MTGPGPHDDTRADPGVHGAVDDLRRVVTDLERSVARLEGEVAERTADLKRLKAEYDNYRKRVKRDQWAVREQALVNVLKELLPVLDDIGRARAQDEPGGLQRVARSFENVLGRLGLETFGNAGDRFDSALHEPLTGVRSPDVDEPEVARVLQPGYRAVGRVLRPAWVEVLQPVEGEAGGGQSDR